MSARRRSPAGSAVRALVPSLLALAVASLPQPASAAPNEPSRRGATPLPDTLEDGGRGDGVYGRFDGPFGVAAGLGVELAPASGAFRPTAHGTLRFYQSVGLELDFAQAVTTSDPLERSLAASLGLSPLFLVRWSGDHEWGHAFWDLALDSLAVSGGVVLAEPRSGSFGDTVAFRLGLGAGLPLLGRANGPWLRFGGRIDAGTNPNVVGAFFAQLEWQWIPRAHSGD